MWPCPWRRPGRGLKWRGGRGESIPVLTLVEDGLWRWFLDKERPAAGCRQWWLGGSVGGAVGQCELAGEVWGGEEVAPAFYRP
jgi:hypothetical protein